MAGELTGTGSGEGARNETILQRRYFEGRLMGLRTNRYSWWTHARELADYLLPRRYKWLITPNQTARGSPINQHILDSTGTLAARNLSSGITSGISSPIRPWFNLKVGRIDTTQTSPASLWLAECRRLMLLVLHESNFYESIAQVYFDLVIFGTAVLLVYEDFDDVIHCYTPCFGEYYVDVDGKLRPCVFYREFTLTIAQVVERFGYENCSQQVQELWNQRSGSSLTREIVVAHAIEPNEQPEKLGFPKHFPYREVYWEYGGTGNPQGGGTNATGFLSKRGFMELPAIIFRWDLVANDAYGRSPGMDALPDVKQLQQETKRKAQAIDKHVNPPMVADIQMKNQPASLLPGGVTYIQGMTTGKVGFAPAYTVQPELAGITQDIALVQDRIRKTFYNDIIQTISQYETRSNVTAQEIDVRKAESLIMLGPVFGRVHDALGRFIDRVWGIMVRANIFPEPPQEIAGKAIDIEYISILSMAQDAAAAGGIERLFGISGNLVGVDPSAIDNVDIDYGLEKYSHLLNNDPKLIRSPEALAAIRADRARQAQLAQQAEMAEKLAAGAKTLSETDVGGGANALQAMTGGP